MTWYTFRTFFHTRLIGAAKGKDADYHPGVTALEERITLVKAKDYKAAEKKAMKEADEYIKARRCRNAYGQRVVMQRMKYLESYELDGRPNEGDELFSNVEAVPPGQKAAVIVRRKTEGISTRPFAAMFIASFISKRLDKECPAWRTPDNIRHCGRAQHGRKVRPANAARP